MTFDPIDVPSGLPIALAQMTAMLALGLIAAWALARRPARAHAALVLAALAAVAAPLAATAARRADLGLLPAATAGALAAPPLVPNNAVTPGIHQPASALNRAPSTSGPLPDASTAATSATTTALTTTITPTSSTIPWLTIALAAWALLSMTVLIRTVIAAWHARRLIARTNDPVPSHVRAAALAAARELALRRDPLVRATTAVTSPLVWCWGLRPIVVVPAGTPDGVDWASVMRHELAHWSRRDHLADALVRVIITLVPFHPLAWVAHRRLERLAERACDDWAVSPAGNAAATAYAQSLVTLASRTRGPRLALPAAREGSDLSARVRRILIAGAAFPRAGRSWIAAGVITAAAATALTALARQPAPQPEQKPAPAEQPDQPDPKHKGANNPARPKPPEIPADVDITAAVKMVHDALAAGQGGRVFTLAGAIAERKDPRAIPLLIGVIDSDNTYWSVYGVGYFGLSHLTGVNYDDRYDGTWWKAWWQKNKANYPAEARATAIPDYPATKDRIAQVYDFGAWVGLDKGEPPERLLKEIERRLVTGDGNGLDVSDLSQRLVREQGPRAIPLLIGVIDSDNTYSTIYGVGYFGLSKITGVRYDDRRDGPWWRAWWEKNKSKFPLDAQQTSIPAFTKSAKYVPSVYDHGQWIGEVDTEPTARLMAELKRRLEADSHPSAIAQQIAERNDPSVIPEMIAIIQADKGGHAKYDVGYFGLGRLTGVKYEDDHDGVWWGKWWEENKARYAGRASAELPQVKLEAPPPRAEPGDNDAASDVKDVPNTDITLNNDPNKRYFLIGAAKHTTPHEPLGLLVILPGGDGSADFNPFIRRIWQNALPKGFIVAQAVAPKWRTDDNRIVWPTEKLPDDKMKFSTEQFMEEIVKDVKSKANIDPDKVFAMGWSSSGPPVYAATMREGSSFKGAFVAMSVYHPDTLPEPKGLKGKSFYVFHSPQDFIKMTFPRKAIEQISAGGARTTLVEYEGGHGWKGNIWKNIRTGVEWLIAKDDTAPAKPEK